MKRNKYEPLPISSLCAPLLALLLPFPWLPLSSPVANKVATFEIFEHFYQLRFRADSLFEKLASPSVMSSRLVEEEEKRSIGNISEGDKV